MCKKQFDEEPEKYVSTTYGHASLAISGNYKVKGRMHVYGKKK